MLPASNEHASGLQPYEPLHAVPAVDGATVRPRQQDENTVATIQELAASLELLEASLATALPASELQATRIAQITLDRDTLRASIDASRKNLRNTLAVLPFDVLAPIFALVYETGSTSKMHACWEATRISYALASVCRHWRRVALATPILWRLFAVSNIVPRPKDCMSFMQHLGRMTSRSGTRGLDVRIELGISELWDADGTVLDFWSKFFTQLIPAVSRLHTFEVDGSCIRFDSPNIATFCAGLSTLLSCSTPLLENLSLRFGPRFLDDPEKPFPSFLPNAPSLRRLSLHGVPFMPSLSSAVLSSLTHLTFADEEIFAYQFWEMLSQAQNLEFLDIMIDKELMTSPNHTARRTDSLSMRELRLEGDLLIHGFFASGLPEMPNLVTLYTEDFILGNLVLTEALARSLTHLDIFMRVENVDFGQRRQQFAHMRCMWALRDVGLNYEWDFDDDEEILFAELCSPDEPMWPHLRTLKITGLSCDDFSEERDGLLRLLRARNSPRISNDSSTPVPIESVSFDTKYSVPHWVAVEVEAILGENCPWLQAEEENDDDEWEDGIEDGDDDNDEDGEEDEDDDENEDE